MRGPTRIVWAKLTPFSLQLLDAFDLPVISLMDCPGMMVGPEVE
jgi:acetyl-CoA carboxylase carboxyltransferase component